MRSAFTHQNIKGVEYAVVAAAAGSYVASYIVDVTPPAISQVAVAVNNTTATITWQTNEPATTRVEYGTNPNQLGSVITSPDPVLTHSVELNDLALGTTYYYRVTSADGVNNLSTSPVVTAPPAFFATPATPIYTCPCSIWNVSHTPSQPSAADPNTIEVGLKFTAATDGFVTAIRFYKGPQNTGVHVGHLWTAGGALLSTVTFTGETATGWQEAQLATPVAVAANTTYVVSYLTNTGFYAADVAYFSTTGRTNGPLTALSNAAGGGNGVYAYGGGFPTSTFNSNNYWVDLVFVTTLTSVGPPSTSVTDTTVSDFSAGSSGAGVYLSQSGDGEIALAPAFGEEFTGTALPAGWSTSVWTTGGTASVAGGQLTVDGSLVATDAQLSPGQSLEFAATFSTDAAQHAGFALTFSESRWAMFSTGGDGNALYARTHDGTTPRDTLIPGSWAGTSHRYRIDWNASSVTFFIDGAQVAAHAAAVSGPLRPVISDFNAGGGTVGVGSAHLAPYAPSGTFTSRVLDAGSAVNWASVDSIVSVPAGSTLALSARFGNTAVPDGSWTPFTAVATGSATITAASRYVQYQVALAGDGAATPELRSITFSGPNVLPPPAIAVSDVALDEGDTGIIYVPFVFSLSRASTTPVSVSYSTSPISASEGGDYVAATGTATFDPGVTLLAVYVLANGDTVLEPEETFALNLSAPVNGTLATTQSIATLIDDDLPRLSIGNQSVTEGNSGSLNAQFTVTLNRTSTQTITVNYATANGTATAGSDYTTTAGQLSFTPGATTRTITVPVLGDVLDEDNETFVVSLNSPVNASILAGNGTGTINDNDASPSLSVNSVAVAEGNSGTASAILTATLSAVSGRSVTVNFTSADGTATQPFDYASTSGTLTFAPGVTTRPITVQVVGDTIQEPNETFVVTLNGSVNATIATAQGTGTIGNDDSQLSIGNVTVTEGNTGAVNAQFTVTLAPASSQTVTVNYATANGTALAGSDYTAASGQLSFTPGATTRTITVPVLGDTLDEDNEAFVVSLTGAVNSTIVTADGTGTITDNDATPTLTFANVGVTEGDTGTLNAVFTVNLSAASGKTVTVNYATANGTALAPADYASTTGTLSYPSGTTSRQVLVPIVGDLLDEANETFTVTLSVPVNATVPTATRTGTITDNDPAPTVSIDNVSLTEGNSGNKLFTFTITMSAPSGRSVTVNFATANGTALAGGSTADYAAASGSRVIAAGATTQTIAISVRGNTIAEPNETFFVNLTSATNATIGDGQGLGTILNDD